MFPEGSIEKKILLDSFFRAFGLIQKHQKIKHREKQRVRAPALAERSRKIYAVCARSLRALAQVSSLFPLFSQCIPAGRNSLKYNFKRFALRPKPEERHPQPPHAEGCIVPPAASDASSAGRRLKNDNPLKRPIYLAILRRLGASRPKPLPRGGPQYASYAGIDLQIEQVCDDPAAPCGKTNSRSRTGRTAATGKEILPQCYFTNRRVRISENKYVHLRDATGVAAQDVAAGRRQRAPADSAASGSGRLRRRLETRI